LEIEISALWRQGGMPERLNGAVSKTVMPLPVSEVRILLPPHLLIYAVLGINYNKSKPAKISEGGNLLKKFMSLFSKKPNPEPANIEEVLAKFKELQNNCGSLREEVKKLREENIRMIDKVGIVRFNPFEGLGSNQSFSLALLDGNDSGAVITSLFSRDGNRVYGKPIKQGTSEFKLTEEETKAIELAKNNNQQ
jgi:hypothetical protein